MRLPAPFVPRFLGLALGLGLALAGCDTAEERAESHYRRGMALLAAGDADRAAVEFRNVFDLNGDHTAARLAYAGLLKERGELREAYGQYLRLVEQDPASLEGRKQVVELAMTVGNFPDARIHIDAAYAMAPQDTRVRALKATLDYAAATDRPAAVAMARAVLAEDPSQVPAHMILIADRVNSGQPRSALPLIAAALAAAPRDEALHLVKLSTLETLGDAAATGAQLEAMVALFPDNPSFAQALVRWHLRGGDTDRAEALLRDLAAQAPDDPQARLQVAQFLLETRGPDAARAELDALIAAAATPAPFQRARAELDFARGDTAAGIAALRQLVDGAEPSDTRRDMQIALAGMLDATGDAAGRDALVAAVLDEDPAQVAALKLRARRQIDADSPELALQDLRTALGEAPRDPAIMTLMAEAHLREGARELAGERLALAVEAANRAPDVAIRYARFLIEDGRLGPAEGVIVDALKLDRENRDLLITLGEIHLARRDWGRATEIAGLLRAQDDPAAARMADTLEATALSGQNRLDETAALLREMVAADDANLGAIAGLLRTYVAKGDLAAAETLLGARLAADPASVPLRMMQAGLRTAGADPAAAETLYRAILDENPTYAPAWRALFALLNGRGDASGAEAVLDQGIAAAADPSGLLFIKAALLEAREDFDGAIALYADLYARDSSSEVIANNLASLLTTHRSDAASLERAFSIARRLRSSDVPYFQDTYGWILTRRGDPEQALSYLEPAAAGLPENALVQFHLGMTHLALERREEARAALERAVAVAGPESTLPQIAEARARLAEIATSPASAPPTNAAPAPAATPPVGGE